MYHHIRPDSPTVSDQSLALYVALRVSLAAGLRTGEVLNGYLKAANISIVKNDHGEEIGLAIDKILPKTEKHSVVPQSVIALEQPGRMSLLRPLKRWADRKGLRLGDKTDERPVFTKIAYSGKEGVWKKDSYQSALQKVFREAGSSNWRSYTGYSARATLRTQSARDGVPNVLVKEAYGWRSEVVEVYDRRKPEEVLRDLAKARNKGR